MQRFTPQVKLHTLDVRRSGKTWKQVQQSIIKTFGIDPPSIRAMEKWEKEIDREKLSRIIVDQTKKQLPKIELEARQQMLQGLMPLLWQARDAGADVELETWLWFFSLIERQLGSAKFDSFFSEYNSRRPKGVPTQDSTPETSSEADSL
ncbi:MAG: hypothetical protein JXB43_02035 [Dehalococcoidia bacterium]|nr:hypothetical protein [Dehalococcoidia bacterium]